MRDGDGKFVPENIPASKCTHVVYAFAKLDENAMSPAPSGPLADINDDYYARVIKTVRQGNPAAKVLIAMGGWADSAGDKYSKLVNSPANVDKFVSNTQKFLKVKIRFNYNFGNYLIILSRKVFFIVCSLIIR